MASVRVHAEELSLGRVRDDYFADPALFEALIRQHERAMRQLAYRLLGSRERMEDALQEACLRAYRARASFRPRGEDSERAWLFRILYRTCIDDLRGRRHEHVSLDPAQEERAAGEAIEDVAARSELAAAVAALPVDLRGPLLLVDVVGFDYRTTGRLLGLAEGTIASRLFRARASLRLALADELGTRTEVEP
jgi:RNA polymerase sigma-70 factor, ECF subfamily